MEVGSRKLNWKRSEPVGDASGTIGTGQMCGIWSNGAPEPLRSRRFNRNDYIADLRLQRHECNVSDTQSLQPIMSQQLHFTFYRHTAISPHS